MKPTVPLPFFRKFMCITYSHKLKKTINYNRDHVLVEWVDYVNCFLYHWIQVGNIVPITPSKIRNVYRQSVSGL